jgi:hypothetical protein
MPLFSSRSYAVARQHITTGVGSYFAPVDNKAGFHEGMESSTPVSRGDMDKAPGDTLVALNMQEQTAELITTSASTTLQAADVPSCWIKASAISSTAPSEFRARVI